jgi:four helix bundle protein
MPTYAATDLKSRTKAFALRMMRLAESLPRGRAADHLAGQLLRSGTSVGANYRAACRARSAAEFCSKLGVVEEEADESVFWMEFLVDGGILKKGLLDDLMREGRELVAIVVASIKTARKKKRAANQRKLIPSPR